MRITQKKHRDPQRLRPMGECSRCGAEQYPGGVCWRVNGQVICEDCALAWLLAALGRKSGEAVR